MTQSARSLDEFVEIGCVANCRRLIKILKFFLVEKNYKNYLSMKVKEEFFDRSYFDGYYISKIGFIYCSRKCWKEFITQDNLHT